jgi:hypothetical protein
VADVAGGPYNDSLVCNPGFRRRSGMRRPPGCSTLGCHIPLSRDCYGAAIDRPAALRNQAVDQGVVNSRLASFLEL